MELRIDQEHQIGSLRLHAEADEPKTAETIRVEHRIGSLTGELVLRFDDGGRLFSVTFLHPFKQLLQSQLDEAAPTS